MKTHPLALLAFFFAARLPAASFTVVDVVTDNLEYAQNSEPSLAVNPSNPQQIFLTAFGDFAQPSPIFFSGDGAASWSVFESVDTSDSSLTWPAGGSPYLAHITGETVSGLVVRKATAPFSATGNFVPLGGASYLPSNVPDQPWVRAVNVGGVDRIYASFNDLSQQSGKSASVRFSLDGGTTWTRTVVERIVPALGGDGPPVRVAVNGNTVYVAFQRWRFDAGSDVGGDIVVVKDTAAGAHGFSDLGQGGTGAIAARSQVFPQSSLGQERLGSDLSLAVDPSNANNVYVSFATLDDLNEPIVEVLNSKNGGVSWNLIYTTRARAGLPAVAVAGNGTVGLLYTAYLYLRLETHLAQTTDDFFHVADTTISRFADMSLTLDFDPYIGDFQSLLAVGNTFHGAFSASNDTSQFPIKPTFLRNSALLGSTVPFSIDPFYFNTPAITSAPATSSPPIANDDNLVFQNVADATAFVAVNDVDPGGDVLSVQSIGQPAHGSAIKAGTGSVVYTPGRTFTGTDSFTYTIVNSIGLTGTATVHVSNPYYRLAGIFTGVVTNSPADQASRGLLSISVVRNGAFTGTLYLAGLRYGFRGVFAIDGSAIATINRPQGPITLTLSLDLAGDAGITASISNGVFNSTATALRTVYSATVTSAQAGYYTFALLHDPANSLATVPHGDGWGIAAVASNGLLRTSAALADGTKVSQGIAISNGGVWPLYSLLYGNKGSISGEIPFATTTLTDLASSSIAWIKPAVPTDVRYQTGFNTTLSLVGAKYTKPSPAGPRVILDAVGGLGLADLSGGGLAANIDSNFQISTANKITADLPNTNNLAITLNTANGIFVGSVKPDANPAIVFTGTVVTKQNAGFGFFLSKTSAGRAALTTRGP